MKETVARSASVLICCVTLIALAALWRGATIESVMGAVGPVYTLVGGGLFAMWQAPAGKERNPR